MSPVAPDPQMVERLQRAQAGCTRFLQRDVPETPAAALVRLASATTDPLPDRYGEHGELALLEAEVAELLGKPAAVFMPSGIMAQQCVLRAWTDRSGHSVVGVHGLSHLVVHEARALEVLHGIRMEHLTDERRPLLAADLASYPGRLGALCVELPLRDAGYLLPSWEELAELVQATRERGVPVHLDGARLWESSPFYSRDNGEMAALFDSVYVSFYKGLGGLGSAALAGPADLVDETRRWQKRHGGTLITQYPQVVAAREGLRCRLQRFGAYAECARAVAAALAAVPGLRVHPDPPHTNSFVVYADVPRDALQEAVLRLAEDRHVWALAGITDAEVPGWSATEFVVGEATMDWSPGEIADLVDTILGAAREAARTTAAHPS